MRHLLKVATAAVLASMLSGCITESASWVSEPLQPAAGEPVAYLVGSLGPQLFKLSPAENQRLFFRKRGSEYGAAGIWKMAGAFSTPQDVQDGRGAASVFVLPLKPGDYEFYDFQFFSARYTPGLGTVYSSMEAREKFNLPLRLEAGKAYYIGEFRSMCLTGNFCAFQWRDQSSRDAVFAQRQVPGLPTLQPLNLDLKRAEPYIFAGTAPGAALDVKP
ncbi:hypothetical protein [Pseudomonas atagonensis]|uniref:hypothetical protein n=1 Tax=Pseudomonas atagonensis TaxID=2609964 RepID=UPI00140C463B|nr:hypothetical protein [Pseudomonas atagonensis]